MSGQSSAGHITLPVDDAVSGQGPRVLTIEIGARCRNQDMPAKQPLPVSFPTCEP